MTRKTEPTTKGTVIDHIWDLMEHYHYDDREKYLEKSIKEMLEQFIDELDEIRDMVVRLK